MLLILILDCRRGDFIALIICIQNFLSLENDPPKQEFSVSVWLATIIQLMKYVESMKDVL